MWERLVEARERGVGRDASLPPRSGCQDRPAVSSRVRPQGRLCPGADGHGFRSEHRALPGDLDHCCSGWGDGQVAEVIYPGVLPSCCPAGQSSGPWASPASGHHLCRAGAQPLGRTTHGSWRLLCVLLMRVSSLVPMLWQVCLWDPQCRRVAPGACPHPACSASPVGTYCSSVAESPWQGFQGGHPRKACLVGCFCSAIFLSWRTWWLHVETARMAFWHCRVICCQCLMSLLGEPTRGGVPAVMG